MEPHSHRRNTTALPGFDDANVAERCARRIENYWTRLGSPNVRCRVDCINGDQNHQSMYVIRSNLIKGLPPEACAWTEPPMMP
jgi:hypothetical protein